MFRRIFFSTLTALAISVTVMIVFTVVCSLLGIDPSFYLEQGGLNYPVLFVFCLLWGFIGSFIQLKLSKTLIKRQMRLQILDPNAHSGVEGQLVQTVYRLAKGAGLEKMPEVAIYDSPEVNAFATGPSKNNSLVAVSTGLLQSMSMEEVEGVLGHEVAHIANGDMVTMSIVQGIVNAFVMFFAKIAAYAIASAMQNSDDEGHHPGFFVVFMIESVFYVLFGVLGALVTAYFSRYREFRADAGGARIAGRQKMVAALQRLSYNLDNVDTKQKELAAFKISSGREGLMNLFRSHPPLKQRIERLQQVAG